MSYRAVIFDLYGTLVDNYGYGFEAEGYGAMLGGMAGALGLTREAFVDAWERSYSARTTGQYSTLEAGITAAAGLLGANPEPERIAGATAVRSEFVRRSLTPRPDAVETLSALRAQGFKTGLISNCGPDTAALWPTTELAALIDVPVLSCAVGLAKPDPDIFWLACERLDVEPVEALYVADGEAHELAAATRVGLTGVLIRSSYRDPPWFRQPHVEPWEGAQIAWLREVQGLVS